MVLTLFWHLQKMSIVSYLCMYHGEINQFENMILIPSSRSVQLNVWQKRTWKSRFRLFLGSSSPLAHYFSNQPIERLHSQSWSSRVLEYGGGGGGRYDKTRWMNTSILPICKVQVVAWNVRRMIPPFKPLTSWAPWFLNSRLWCYVIIFFLFMKNFKSYSHLSLYVEFDFFFFF